MRKLLIPIILSLCIPALAQQREGDKIDFIVTYISRDRLIEILEGDKVKAGDFEPFTASTKGSDIVEFIDRKKVNKDFVTFEKAFFVTLGTANEDRARLIQHIKEFALEVENICNGGVSRGQDCTIHHGLGIVKARN